MSTNDKSSVTSTQINLQHVYQVSALPHAHHWPVDAMIACCSILCQALNRQCRRLSL